MPSCATQPVIVVLAVEGEVDADAIATVPTASAVTTLDTTATTTRDLKSFMAQPPMFDPRTPDIVFSYQFFPFGKGPSAVA